MADESLNDLAISFLARLESASLEMADYNDYGDVTGFCDEYELIASNAESQFRALRQRARRLENRILKHKLLKTKEAENKTERKDQ